VFVHNLTMLYRLQILFRFECDESMIIKDEVKSKAVPLHAMEAHGGRGGIAPAHS
jgi:hypothetical protein